MTKIKNIVIIQDINSPLIYSIHAIEIAKADGRIMGVEILESMDRIEKNELNSSVAILFKLYKPDNLITPIPRFLQFKEIKSIYQPRIGHLSKRDTGDVDGLKHGYRESLAITYYMEMLPFITGSGSYDKDFSTAIYLDDGARENVYRINHYEIESLTLALMYSIYWSYKRGIHDLFRAVEIIAEDIKSPTCYL
jgi:hypothetical protein